MPRTAMSIRLFGLTSYPGRGPARRTAGRSDATRRAPLNRPGEWRVTSARAAATLAGLALIGLTGCNVTPADSDGDSVPCGCGEVPVELRPDGFTVEGSLAGATRESDEFAADDSAEISAGWFGPVGGAVAAAAGTAAEPSSTPAWAAPARIGLRYDRGATASVGGYGSPAPGSGHGFGGSAPDGFSGHLSIGGDLPGPGPGPICPPPPPPPAPDGFSGHISIGGGPLTWYDGWANPYGYDGDPWAGDYHTWRTPTPGRADWWGHHDGFDHSVWGDHVPGSFSTYYGPGHGYGRGRCGDHHGLSVRLTWRD